MSLARDIKDRARELGFMACGITDTSPVAHAAELDHWLARGYGGTMRYLNRQAKRRKSPGRIAPQARSIIIVSDNYYYRDRTPEDIPHVASYARGTDYHTATVKRINELADWLRAKGATMAHCYVDAGPVPERELAQRAGLGWIGKNTMLISPRAGSFFFLGAVFTDLEVEPDPPFTADFCGTCTRCLDACPTDALVGPRELDATRCISYLTIEYRGDVPAELASRFEGWGFGCDICNDVCPWNIRFARESEHGEFRPRGIWQEARTREFFDSMDEDEFERLFGDTPLERPGLAGMRRNWALAFATGDGGDKEATDGAAGGE